MVRKPMTINLNRRLLRIKCGPDAVIEKGADVNVPKGTTLGSAGG